MIPHLYIFNGPPGSGKTTMAKFLSQRLSIKVIDKDTIKLFLYDKYGFYSVDEKSKLEMLAEENFYGLIQQEVEQQNSFIIDKWFTGSDKIQSILTLSGYTITEFHLIANADELRSRMIHRLNSFQRTSILELENHYPINHLSTCKNVSLRSNCASNISKTSPTRLPNSNFIEINTNKSYLEVQLEILKHL
jgi:adenylate kinase family enzyme